MLQTLHSGPSYPAKHKVETSLVEVLLGKIPKHEIAPKGQFRGVIARDEIAHWPEFKVNILAMTNVVIPIIL